MSDDDALQARSDADNDPSISIEQQYELDDYFMKHWPDYGREAFELADLSKGGELSED